MAEVVVLSDRNLRQEIWSGTNTFYADEPAEVGGDGTAPGPYELLLGALGACTSMTLLLYARRKEWPLERVEIRLRHSRVHQQDCVDCEKSEPFLDHIEKEIVGGGPLSEEQVQRLGEIAERCPVNQTLHRSVTTHQEIRRAAEAP